MLRISREEYDSTVDEEVTYQVRALLLEQKGSKKVQVVMALRRQS